MKAIHQFVPLIATPPPPPDIRTGVSLVFDASVVAGRVEVRFQRNGRPFRDYMAVDPDGTVYVNGTTVSYRTFAPPVMIQR